VSQLAGADAAGVAALRSSLEALAAGANPVAADLLRAAAESLEGQGLLERALRLLDAAASFADAEPRAAQMDIDPEILGDFATETREHCAKAELALLTLENHPEDREAIGTVFRAFHTVKGCAAFLSVDAMRELAHHIESVLMPVRDGKAVFDGECATLALRSLDFLKEILGCLEKAGPNGMLRPSNEAVAFTERLKARTAPTVQRVKPPSDGLFEMAPVASPSPPAVASDRPSAPRAKRKRTAKRKDVETAPVASAAVAAAPPPALIAPAPVVLAAPEITKVVAPPEPTRTPAAAAESEGSVRIRTDRLDRLIDLVGEIVIAQAMSAQDAPPPVDPEAAKKGARLEKLVRELQDLSTSLRMVPLRATFQKMVRVVRDTARASGRSAELVTQGEDTEIDRNMVDAFADPLVHMLRNAVDHGIEAPEVRVAAGKAARGTVNLRAFHSGGNVVVELSDDGAGLDRARIVAKAIARRLIVSDLGMSDGEVFNLIFEAGFSTRDEVTELSGRGVGMDVVRRSILGLNGRIEIASELGKGTTFRIKVPLTLAITDGMLVRVGDERFVVPTGSIQVILRPEPEMLVSMAGRGELLMLRGQALPLVRLHQVLSLPRGTQDATEGVVIIVNDGDAGYALLVDELLGQQQVVAKPVRGMVRIAGISGGAILSDGRVGLILDASAIGTMARDGASAPHRRAREGALAHVA
jgi:two-component system, chemotaxis family, sensor kinase CheA